MNSLYCTWSGWKPLGAKGWGSAPWKAISRCSWAAAELDDKVWRCDGESNEELIGFWFLFWRWRTVLGEAYEASPDILISLVIIGGFVSLLEEAPSKFGLFPNNPVCGIYFLVGFQPAWQWGVRHPVFLHLEHKAHLALSTLHTSSCTNDVANKGLFLNHRPLTFIIQIWNLIHRGTNFLAPFHVLR